MSVNVAKLKKKAAEFEQKKQFDKALQLYQQVIDEMDPSEGEADVALFNRVGDLLLRQGDVAGAVNYYERAVDLYSEGGFFNNAIALCNKILRQSPGRTSIYYKLGKISAKKGFRSDAKQNFLEYADRMQKAGQLDEAFRALKEFADLCPDQDDIRLMLAEQLSKMDRKGEALEQLQTLYDRFDAEGRSAEARATVDRMKAIDPEVDPKPSGREQRSNAGDLVFLDVGFDDAPQRPRGPRKTVPIRPPEVGDKRPTRKLTPEEIERIEERPAASTGRDGARDDASASEVTRLESFDATLADDRPLHDVGGLPGFERTMLADEEPELGSMPPALDIEPTMLVGGSGVDDAPPLGRASRHDLALPGELPMLEIPGVDSGDADTLDASMTIGEPLDMLETFPTFDDLPTEERFSTVEGISQLDMPTVRPEQDESDAPDESPWGQSSALASDDAERAADLLAELEPPLARDTADLPFIEPALDATPAAGSLEISAEDIPPLAMGGSSLFDTEVELAPEVEPPRAAAPTPDISLEGIELTSSTPKPARPAPEPIAFTDPDLAAIVQPTRPSTSALTESLDSLRERVRRDQADWGLRRTLGEALLESGQREEGLHELELAMIGFERANDLPAATGVAAEIIRVNPHSVRHHQKRVEYAFRTNDRNALVEAYLELADSLFRAGQAEKARAVYGRVLDLHPDDLRARAALSAFVDAVPAPPAPKRPSALGTTTGTGRRYTAEVSRPAEPPPPPEPEAASEDFVNLGDWLRSETPTSTRMVVEEQEPSGDEEADFADMLRRFKQGVAENVDAEDYQSHYDLGVAYKQMGLVEEAIAEFQKALRGSAHRARTYEALGQCFVEKSQFQLASTILARALMEKGQSDETLVGVLYLLGYAAEAMGRVSDALDYYQRVFVVDIQFRDVSERIARLEQVAT